MVIIDCGTGAISLGREIVGNYFAKKAEVSVLCRFHYNPSHTDEFLSSHLISSSGLKFIKSMEGMETTVNG